jgi:hypothetical protein
MIVCPILALKTIPNKAEAVFSLAVLFIHLNTSAHAAPVVGQATAVLILISTKEINRTTNVNSTTTIRLAVSLAAASILTESASQTPIKYLARETSTV